MLRSITIDNDMLRWLAEQLNKEAENRKLVEYSNQIFLRNQVEYLRNRIIYESH